MTRSRAPQTDVEDLLDGPRPADPLAARVFDVAVAAAERRRAAAEATAPDEAETAESGAPPQTPIDVRAERTVRAARRSRTLQARLDDAGGALSPLDQPEVFAAYPVVPQREFPTQLTRWPIFRPSHRVTQQGIQDTDNAVAFDTAWGQGRRLGPPLTIRDEDTLIALIRLRDRAIFGPASSLPLPVREIVDHDEKSTEVHRLQCTLHQVVGELGLRDAGSAYKTTLDSIRRLGACTIEIAQTSADGRGSRGRQIRLIDVNWVAYDDHAVVDVVFPPMITRWLRTAYSYLDWEVRRGLKGALTKAVHRFLSGQGSSYTIGCDKLAAAVGYDGRRDHMRGKFRTACQELERVGWLESWTIEGNGRTRPLMLSTHRAT